ncbi:MAG TPA: hypothetical protein PKC39_07560 [Ferruginibacter sp.]|nr:hypothetical protein [Ferruginibacter sp.]HMP20800.1 hypothetical protein [Ferruginibacter sp.]
MKMIACLTFIACLAAGCSRSDKALHTLLSGADSVAINYFKGNGLMDTVVAIKIIRNPEEVQQLAAFISMDVRRQNKTCGYDGSVHFFKNNMVLQDVYYRVNDAGCMFFWLTLNGRAMQCRLDEGARQLLEKQRQ